MPDPHGLNQPEEEHGVQVVNRLGSSAEALLLSIARQSQNVLDALARQTVKAAFQEGTVSILGGEMSNRCQAPFLDERDKGFRGQRRVAARQVGHTDDLDPVRLRRRFFDEGLRLGHVVIAAQDQLRGAEKLFLFERQSQMVLRPSLSILSHLPLLSYP